MKRAAALLLLAATLLYPFAVYWGLGHLAPRWVALGLLGILLARLYLQSQDFLRGALLAGALLALFAFVDNTVLPLKLYPVAVSAGLLVLFSVSLYRPPTVIERLARLRDPKLSPQAIAYTRNVTVAWCIFFVCNGALALITALYASERLWAFYNGFLAYMLMAVMFTVEWLIRRRVQAGHTGA